MRRSRPPLRVGRERLVYYHDGRAEPVPEEQRSDDRKRSSHRIAMPQQCSAGRPLDEKTLLEKMTGILRAETQKEADLERDVHAMLDKLEASHGGQFEEHKMYPMLKQKMAKERKVIL